MIFQNQPAYLQSALGHAVVITGIRDVRPFRVSRNEGWAVGLAAQLDHWVAEGIITRGWSSFQAKLARWAYRAYPRLAVASLEIDSTGLRFRETPQLFSRDLRQIDPSLNEDLLDLFGRSEQTLANHFGFFNRSQKFGPEIDWQCRESSAWLRELHAFDYAFDLALTYRISLEEKYALHLC